LLDEIREIKPMPRKTTIAILSAVLAFAVAISLALQSTQNTNARPEAKSSTDDIAQLIQRIEAPQVPNRQGLDGLTLQELMKQFHTPGVSVAVIKDFKIHWAKGYGLADVKSGRPVETNTMFQAASISKPVTAMAALKLVQEGKLSLDENVNTILKSWQVPDSEFTRKQPVTPRSLFSHTSGADDGFGFPGYAPNVPLPTPVQILNHESVSNVGPVFFTRPAYRGFKYSGGGVLIMQVALTDLTGEPFDQFMRKTVLQPLGMSDSTYNSLSPMASPPTPLTRMAMTARPWTLLGTCIPNRQRPDSGPHLRTWHALPSSCNARSVDPPGRC
jgi:CubicO group peptidase (beta-lactamase class C family)